VTGQSDAFCETDEEICLKQSELGDPARIAAAYRWAAFQKSMKLVPYASHHELSKLLQEQPELKDYAGIID